MNALKTLENWVIGTYEGRKEYIMGELHDGDHCENFIGTVLRVDFEKRLVETDEGYFKLGESA